MLVKHSRRTVRKGCKHCGSTNLYWAHETDSDSGQYCEQCDVTGKWLMIEPSGEPHDCQKNRVQPDPVSVPEVTPVSAPATPVAPASTTTGGDAFQAFQALMSALAPKVDRAEVQGMIKAELENVTFPTRTVVERATGERKEITGAHVKLADVVTDILAGEHVLMVGPAGTGKSTLAEQAAEALGLAYYAISLSPMTPASQILGYMQAEGAYVRTLYRDAYEHGGVFHFDEFDNAHPSVLAVINASLANGQMAFPDGMVKRHPDFRCVASANTYGRGPDRQYVGRQQIDTATLDRFSVETIEVDETLETELCNSTGLESGQVKRVLDYVRKLRRTAETKGMAVVVSPRASVGMCRLLRAGKSWESAVDARIRRGLSDQDWRKLNDTV
jgi:cobaltochelatase CobS